MTPGTEGHCGFDLRDFFLDVALSADGQFSGSHTAYLPAGKDRTDPADVGLFRYRRSHVLLGAAVGRLDLRRGTGVLTVGGYGSARLTVRLTGQVMVLHLHEPVIENRPVMYSRAVLLRQA